MMLPGLEERWRFVESTLRKAPFIKIVPMLASLGCPYSCEFCIDASIPYQPLSFDVMKGDLRFLLTKHKRPIVGWHDPNFGVRFNDNIDAIAEAVPPNRIDFIGESSLSLLSEAHVKRLAAVGFKAVLPGVESWFAHGDKSRTGARQGMDKVHLVSEQVNMILRYIPYVQTNFVLGLDCDAGPEPFELTKRFVDLSPGAFPGYSLLTAFGRAAPLNLEYQRQQRVLPHPFPLLNNHSAMNVIPRNYSWAEFYDQLISLTAHTYSWPAIRKRFRANTGVVPSVMNVVRSISNEGFGRIRYYRKLRQLLVTDSQFQRYLDGTTADIPDFFLRKIQAGLGPFWEYLPAGALLHDQNAYLKSVPTGIDPPLALTVRALGV
jgi:hypothetical protein